MAVTDTARSEGRRTADSLAVAVVGAGIMGSDHIHRLEAKIGGAHVAAIIEPDPDRARAAGALAPSASLHSRVEDALDSGGIDAVIIATPGPFHEAVLLPALEAGLPILCEKPLTPDSASALRILEAEQRRGRPRIQVGFMRRFDPEYVRLRELIASGELGELLMLHGAHRNASTPPGYVESMLITDSVVHEIDVMPWLVGSPVTAVEVKKTRRNRLAPAGLHEPQLVLLETEDGVLADVEINVNSQFGYQVTTDAVFEQGLVQIGRAAGPLVWQGGRGAVTEHMTYTTRFAPAYDREVERWVAAARAGTIDGPSAWDGYAAAAVCEAALTAQATGRRVEVDYAPRPAFYPPVSD